jgi:hypothetical protein
MALAGAASSIDPICSGENKTFQLVGLPDILLYGGTSNESIIFFVPMP